MRYALALPTGGECGDPRFLVELAERARAGDRPFEIAVGGGRRRDDWETERGHIRDVAEAGATWWMEWVPPAGREAMRAAVQRGPLLI